MKLQKKTIVYLNGNLSEKNCRKPFVFDRHWELKQMVDTGASGFAIPFLFRYCKLPVKGDNDC
jgi:hypothetical protein